MWAPEDRAVVENFGAGQVLSDDQYRLLEPLIPPAKPGGRVRNRRPPRIVVLDMDSSESPTTATSSARYENFSRGATQLARKRDIFMRWSSLRLAGNSPIVRASMLMPVIGYLVILNQHALKMADIDPRFHLVASENPWRLLLIYFGTSFLGIASAIYLTKCPAQVRKYDSPVEYRNEELDFFITRNHRESLEADVLQSAKRLSVRQAQYPEIANIHTLVTDQPFAPRLTRLQMSADNYLTEIMTINWHLKDISQRRWRIASWAIYQVGFIALLIPTGWTFVELSAYTISLVRGLLVSG